MPKLSEETIEAVRKKAEEIDYGEIKLIFRGDTPNVDIHATDIKRVINHPKPGHIVRHYREG